jgi:hypothetical protein
LERQFALIRRIRQIHGALALPAPSGAHPWPDGTIPDPAFQNTAVGNLIRLKDDVILSGNIYAV